MCEDDSKFLCGKTTENVFWSNRSFIKKADVLKEKSGGDVFPSSPRRTTTVSSSLFLRSILMHHLFARSVHTEEGVSSSTRDFSSLFLIR